MNEINNKLLWKFKGLIRLFRPEMAFTAGICVSAGSIISLGSIPSYTILALGFICGFFVSGSTMVLNDYFDYEVDKINAPHRPLPAGFVSKTDTLVLTIFSTVIAFITAYCTNLNTLAICVILWIIGFLYNWKLKETGLLGNLMVSTSVAATFLLGGFITERPLNKIVFIFCLITFLLNLGEEIASDAMDIDGDQKRNSKTIAIQMGKKIALRISGLSFMLMVLVSFLPFYFGWLTKGYLYISLPFDILILILSLQLMKSKTPVEGHLYIRWIFFIALSAIFIFIISQFIFKKSIYI